MQPLNKTLLIQFFALIAVMVVMAGAAASIFLAQRVSKRQDDLNERFESISGGTLGADERGSLSTLSQDLGDLGWITYGVGGAGLLILYGGLMYIVWSGWRSNTMRQIMLEAVNAELEDRVEERVKELNSTNEQLRNEVAQRRQTQKELQKSRYRIITKEESLRREISEVLHGRVQNSLLVAGLRLSECQALMDTDVDQAKTMLTEIRSEVDDIREHDVREASHLLHPSVIRVGLLPAVRTLVGSFEDNYRISSSVDPEIERIDNVLEMGISETVRLVAYRAIQEGMNNIERHTDATAIDLSLSLDKDGWLELEVRDNGKGFDTSKLEPGLGLDSIADRVGATGGGLGDLEHRRRGHSTVGEAADTGPGHRPGSIRYKD